MPKPSVTALNFWDRVQIGNDAECWPWIGYRNTGKRTSASGGYGRIDAFGFKGVYVHRVAFWLSNGGMIDLRKNGDSIIRHSCDNPICCNPAHLIRGTHADNVQDMMDRGRQTKYKSISSPRAKLTADDVRQIRALSAEGTTRKALALLFDVSIQTIKAVRSGRHYKDVS